MGRFRKAVRSQRRNSYQQGVTREERERLNQCKWQRKFGVMWDMEVAWARDVLEEERDLIMRRRRQEANGAYAGRLRVLPHVLHWGDTALRELLVLPE